MKVGIYSPYLDTLGGGERYILTAAEFFLHRKDSVDIFWDKDSDLQDMAARFGLDLKGAKFVSNLFSGNFSFWQRLRKSYRYDLILVLSDGSIPLTLAKKNFIHLQVPFQKSNRPKIVNRLKLLTYKAVLCNSYFTKKIIDQTYGITSSVLYPPVDVNRFQPGKKEKVILSVGRFFAARHLHNFAPKKHQEMISAFEELIDSGLKDWKLRLLGANSPDQQSSLEQLKKIAQNYPIEISSNVDYEDLKTSFAQASIYWHAAGFGEDLDKHPERAEHFGITTVEAMASGAVPVVFAGGGQKEIIQDSVNGLFWQTPGELQTKTIQLIKNQSLTRKLAEKALIRSRDFSKQKFFRSLEDLLK
ncbi:MAG: hypothetical protein UY21_C0001G0060 [Microgenomates group bacterium GW2011_GWA1_48_10]|nr:MAG: hypothetical protein UY21_C0001G0060 [Microgenomates group bacterium GW2011_GWA1_48_10]